jgi:ribosomal protein S18 acetylase RimI-like enzyme
MKIVNGEKYAADIKILVKDYVTSLNRDLNFQNVDDELKNFPEKYTPPNGKLLAAVIDDKVIGCIAYQKQSDTQCEMKRLYVKPEYRKLKAGFALVQAIIDEARKDGFQEMVLDTLRPLESAIRLYESVGFFETTPYYDNPFDDVVYMKLEL